LKDRDKLVHLRQGVPQSVTRVAACFRQRVKNQSLGNPERILLILAS
jgi:hypothetical protein